MPTTKKPRGTKTPPPGALRRRVDPTPDIRVSYSPLGRETLEAIELELASEPTPAPRGHRPPLASGPEIVLTQTPVGRETLAAIQSELRAGPREPQATLPYGDRVPNAAGTPTPSKWPSAAAKRTPPPRASGRGRSRSSRPAPDTAPQKPQIFEVVTFVVRGVDADALAEDADRRRFVEAYLIHRVPARSMAAVGRIDAVPWIEENATIVRLWCRSA